LPSKHLFWEKLLRLSQKKHTQRKLQIGSLIRNNSNTGEQQSRKASVGANEKQALGVANQTFKVSHGKFPCSYILILLLRVDYMEERGDRILSY